MADISLQLLIKAVGRELIPEIVAQVREAEKATKSFGEAAKEGFAIGAGIEAAHKGVELLAGALDELPSKVIESVAALAEASDKLEIMALKTGMSTDELQRLQAMGRPVDVSLDTITSAVEKMKKKLVETPGAFKAIGLSARDLIAMRPDEAFVNVGTAIAGIENPTVRSAVAMKTMSKTASEVLPLFATMAERADLRARELGITIESKTLVAGAALENKFKLLKDTSGGLWNNFAAGIVRSAALHAVITIVTEKIGQLSIWIRKNQDTITFWTTTAILFAVNVFDSLITVVGGVVDVVNFLTLVWDASAIAALAVGRAIVSVIETMLKLGATASGAQVLGKVFGIDLKGGIDAVANVALKNLDAGINTLSNSMKGTVQSNIEFHEVLDKVHGAVDQARKSIVDAKSPMEGLGESAKKTAVDLTLLEGDLKKASEEVAKLDIEVSKKLAEALAASLTGIAAAFGKVDAQMGEFTRKLEEQKKVLGDTSAIRKVEDEISQLTTKLKENALEAERQKVLGEAFVDVARKQKDMLDVMSLGAKIADLTNASLTKLVSTLQAMGKAHELTAAGARVQAEAEAELNQRIAEGKVLAGGTTEQVTAQLSLWQRLTFSWGEAGKALLEMGSKVDLVLGLIDAISQIGPAFNQATDSANAFSRMLGGLKVGEQFGAAIGKSLGALLGGPMGAIIGEGVGKIGGAIIGGLVGLFRKPSWVAVGEEAGRVLGFAVGKELAKAIEQTSKDLGVSVAAATLLSLDKVMQQTGKTAHDMGTQIMELMQGVANGTIPVREGLQAIDSDFQKVRSEADAAGTVGDALSASMLQAAKASGQLTASMKTFLEQQAALAAEGAKEIAEGMAKIDPRVGGISEGWGKTSAQFFVYGFEQEIRSKGMLAALDDQKAGLQKFWDEMTAAGNTSALALLAPFKALEDQINGDSSASQNLRGALEVLGGSDKVFKAMAESGDLTKVSFKGMEDQIQATNNALKEGGVTGDAAMQAIIGSLRDVVSASQQQGFTLDENTQKLVEQAKTMGYAFPTAPIQQVVDLLKVLVQGMGFELPESAKRAGDGIRDGLGAGSKQGVEAVDKGVKQMTDRVMDWRDFNQESAQYVEQQWVSNIGEVPEWMDRMQPAWEAGWTGLADTADPGLKRVKGQTGGILGDLNDMVDAAARAGTAMGDLKGPGGGDGGGPGGGGRGGGRGGAFGLMIPAQPGGETVTLGEGGQTEVAAPVRAFLVDLRRAIAADTASLVSRGGGGMMHVHVEIDGKEIAALVARDIANRRIPIDREVLR